MSDEKTGGVRRHVCRGVAGMIRDDNGTYSKQIQRWVPYEPWMDDAAAEIERLSRQQCHHGWRGSKPDGGEVIRTPCPVCGGQLFIGSGGHLTCANLQCREPDTGDVYKEARKRAESAEAKVAELEAREERMATLLADCQTALPLSRARNAGWQRKEPTMSDAIRNRRYFLDQDNDSHWYIVPLDRKEDWEAWLSIPTDDERGWDVPEFAVTVGGAPQQVTFSDPLQED